MEIYPQKMYMLEIAWNSYIINFFANLSNQNVLFLLSRSKFNADFNDKYFNALKSNMRYIAK